MSTLRKSIAYIFVGIWYVLFSIKSIDGRVAGKVGGSGGNYYSGKLSPFISDIYISGAENKMNWFSRDDLYRMKWIYTTNIVRPFGIRVHRCECQLNRKFQFQNVDKNAGAETAEFYCEIAYQRSIFTMNKLHSHCNSIFTVQNQFTRAAN